MKSDVGRIYCRKFMTLSNQRCVTFASALESQVSDPGTEGFLVFRGGILISGFKAINQAIIISLKL